MNNEYAKANEMTDEQIQAKARDLISKAARTAFGLLRRESHDLTFADYDAIEDAIEAQLNRVDEALGFMPADADDCPYDMEDDCTKHLEHCPEAFHEMQMEDLAGYS